MCVCVCVRVRAPLCACGSGFPFDRNCQGRERHFLSLRPGFGGGPLGPLLSRNSFLRAPRCATRRGPRSPDIRLPLKVATCTEHTRAMQQITLTQRREVSREQAREGFGDVGPRRAPGKHRRVSRGTPKQVCLRECWSSSGPRTQTRALTGTFEPHLPGCGCGPQWQGGGAGRVP